MMQNSQRIQGVLSILALICLAVGWFNLFSPEITDLLYQRFFYILIGLSFVFQARSFLDQKFVYLMYIAAGLCIIGALLPFDSQFARIKTIGLFTGVIVSVFNRQRVRRD
jgi:hypothetical protein